MAATDQYRTLAVPSVGDFRDRGSKFLAFAYPIRSERDANDHLVRLRKEHPKANHACYAWRLGMDGHYFRANDDGEPSGTAGRPILGRIDSYELTNVLVVVVRYFGGTKLGTGGLKAAYKASAEAALHSAPIVVRTRRVIYRLQFSYARMSQVMNAIKYHDLDMIEQQFDANPSIDVALPASEAEHLLRDLLARIAEVHLAEVDKMDPLPGYTATFLRTE